MRRESQVLIMICTLMIASMISAASMSQSSIQTDFAEDARMKVVELAADELNIVITEFLANPAVVGDTEGEWFEIFNAGPTSVDISGFVLSDDHIDNHTISKSLVIAAGSYLVLGANNDTAVNGNVEIDYVYSEFYLSNSGDEIIISDNEANQLDKVTWGEEDDFSGISREFRGPLFPYSISSLLNDNIGNWYNSTSLFGDGDYGTPGLRNSVAVSDLPRPPTNPRATGGEMSIGIAWDEPVFYEEEAGMKFEVHRGTDSGGPYVSIANTTLAIYVDTDVIGGTEYFYVITTVANWTGAEVESLTSDEVSATPEGTQSTVTGPFGLPATILGIDTLYILFGSLVLVIIILVLKLRHK